MKQEIAISHPTGVLAETFVLNDPVPISGLRSVIHDALYKAGLWECDGCSEWYNDDNPPSGESGESICEGCLCTKE